MLASQAAVVSCVCLAADTAAAAYSCQAVSAAFDPPDAAGECSPNALSTFPTVWLKHVTSLVINRHAEHRSAQHAEHTLSTDPPSKAAGCTQCNARLPQYKVPTIEANLPHVLAQGMWRVNYMRHVAQSLLAAQPNKSQHTLHVPACHAKCMAAATKTPEHRQQNRQLLLQSLRPLLRCCATASTV